MSPCQPYTIKNIQWSHAIHPKNHEPYKLKTLLYDTRLNLNDATTISNFKEIIFQKEQLDTISSMSHDSLLYYEMALLCPSTNTKCVDTQKDNVDWSCLNTKDTINPIYILLPSDFPMFIKYFVLHSQPYLWQVMCNSRVCPYTTRESTMRSFNCDFPS